LLAGQVLGQMGDGLAQITFAQVVLFDIGEGATPVEIAGVLAATLLPFSVVGPFAGLVIDRWDRRRVMFLLSTFRVVVVIGGLFALVIDSEVAAYCAVLLLLSLSRFVLAAKGAILPRTVEPGILVKANSESAVWGLTASFVGGVGGSLFVGSTPAAGFLGAALSYAFAAPLFLRLPDVGGGHRSRSLFGGVAGVARDLAEGARSALKVPAVRTPLAAVFSHRFLLGAGVILLVLVADYRYQLEAPGYGLALAVTGVGAFAGSISAPPLARRYRSQALLPVTFMVSGLAALGMGLVPKLGVLIAGTGVAAFAFQVLKVLSDALVQKGSDDAVRGRVFAAYDILYNVAFVTAGLALVPLWEPGRETSLLWCIAAAAWTIAFVMSRGQMGQRTRGVSRDVRRLGSLGLAFVCGALPALSFPEPNLWWLAWVGLVPMTLLVGSARTRREGTMLGWFAGAGYLIGVTHWLTPKIGPGIVVSVFLLGLTWIPWSAATYRAFRGPLSLSRLVIWVPVVASAWVVGESLRSWERLGGPWGLLGTSQWRGPPLLALASLGGVWLVTFVLVAINTCVAGALRSGLKVRDGTRAAAAAVVVATAAVGVGMAIAAPESTTSLTIAGVQPGPGLDAGLRFERQIEMTRDLIAARPDLVVWGESSVGIGLRPDLTTIDRLAELSSDVGSPLLVNIDARRGEGGIYKSSVLLDGEEVKGSYDKMRLVPFGEYVPFRFALGWLTSVSEASEEDRERGDDLKLLTPDGYSIGSLVCFESAFPDMARNLTARGADLIVVQSATSTFQDSWAPEQHAALAAVRAVEVGRPVVHATLTGVSAVYGPSGDLLAEAPTSMRGTYVAEVPLTTGRTPYVRWGDWVLVVSWLLLGGAVIAGRLEEVRQGH
jgi:apolipoprotein N-acyltransferase